MSPQINTPTQVEATLSHDTGASADYRGKVTFTADTGDTCEAFVAAGQRVVSCSFVWTTVAMHSVSAVYSGDVVYQPSAIASISVPITSATHTPVLAADAPSNVIVGADVPVTWRLTDVSQTGNVTVWGDGHPWCDVAVAMLSCTGQFGIASATGGLVDIRVRYDGDANWHSVEDIRAGAGSRAARCSMSAATTRHSARSASIRRRTAAPPDTYPARSCRSPPRPRRPPSSATGSATARPAPSLVLVASTATTGFIVTDRHATWVHVAQFRSPCSASRHPHRDLAASRLSAHRTAPRVRRGRIAVRHEGRDLPGRALQPDYDEPDAFWAFRTLPFGAVEGTDSAGRPLVRLTVTAPAVIR